MRSSSDRVESPAGVGGWLVLLCGFLLIWQPVSLGVATTNAMHAVATRGTPLVALLAARVVATAAGMGAGIALTQGSGIAIPLTRVALTLSAVVEIVVYTTPYFPNNRVPGDTSLLVAATIVNYGLWMLYLARSRRVRATFV